MSKNAPIGKKSIFGGNPIEWVNKYTKKEVDDNPKEKGVTSEPKKMTAYELANKIFKRDCPREYIIEAVVILCEQADLIMELEKDLEACEYFLKNHPIKQTPVAWADELWTIFTPEDYKELEPRLQRGMFPLYKHPVNEESYFCDCCGKRLKDVHTFTPPDEITE